LAIRRKYIFCVEKSVFFWLIFSMPFYTVKESCSSDAVQGALVVFYGHYAIMDFSVYSHAKNILRCKLKDFCIFFLIWFRRNNCLCHIKGV